MERRAYKGGLVKRGYKVSSMKLTKCEENELPVELAKVWSMTEYESGCTLHRDCPFGHMCITPEGLLLPPHSMSFRSGDIKTQYNIAASKAFEGKVKCYIDDLKSTNYGKEGNLRSIMSTPVSGSARLVCASQVGQDPRVVYLSRNLAEKVLFCYMSVDAYGNTESTYSERCLQEGDYVILERAPSLSKYNNQPFVVRFWANECLGVHPKVFSYFHGDYDGDEAHIYPIADEKSLQEALNWIAPLDQKLMKATRYMKETLGREYECENEEGDMNFVSYTTLSFGQIKDMSYNLPIGDLTRTKAEHLNMLSQRMNDTPGTSTFLQDSMKGVRDIMRQQMSQGSIGDMARVAKLAAMCFTRGPNGGTYATLRRSRVLIERDTLPVQGVPSLRCVMSLCQASQQAALDAHRVGSVISTGLDMISDLLMGRSKTRDHASCDTLYVLQGLNEEAVRTKLEAGFCCIVKDRIVAVAKDDKCTRDLSQYIVGAYSPVILALIEPERRRDVCRTGIVVVCNYYSVKFEGDDIVDLSIAMSYATEKSVLPITTRAGLLERNMGWAETLMATDYTKLPYLTGSVSKPWSPTSAAMCSNFDNV